MFYSQFILSKKGPLAKIWLAAHWEKKLSKAQIFETSVQDAVEEIIKPKVKISLRTTGHLLLGIARIYSRQANYVLADCNEALLQIKMAFKPGSKFDKQLKDRDSRGPGGQVADIPEVITDFYDNIPEIGELEMGHLDDIQANQSRIDEITLRDDIRFDSSINRHLAFDVDGGLDDFGERELVQRGGSRASSLMLEELDWPTPEVARKEKGGREMSEGPSFSGALNPPRGSSIVTLFDDIPEKGRDKDAFGLPDEFGVADDLDLIFNLNDFNAPIADIPRAPGADMDDLMMDVDGVNQGLSATQESFQLEPLDHAALQQEREAREARGVGRPRKKRKLIVDDVKQISGDEMKANMNDYSSTLRELDLAPPNKEMMFIKEFGTLEKMFAMPACHRYILDPRFIRNYQTHLVPYSAADTAEEQSQLREELEMTDQLSHADYDDYGGAGSNSGTSPFGGSSLLNGHHDHQGMIPDENLLDHNDDFPEDLGGAAADEPEVQETTAAAEKKQRKSRGGVPDREEEETGDDDRFTKRTKNVLVSIAAKLRTNEEKKITFDELFPRGATRRTAAQRFYALLELKKWQAIEVEQDPVGPSSVPGGPPEYGTIWIGEGPRLQETLQIKV